MLESPAQTKHCAMGGGGYSSPLRGAKRGRRRCLRVYFFSEEQEASEVQSTGLG